MKILVTGRNGFVSREIHKLNKKFDITYVGKNDCDLSIPEEVDEFFEKHQAFDFCINTAVIGSVNHNISYEDVIKNLMIADNLIRHKDKLGHVIHLASGIEQNSLEDVVNNNYAISKKITTAKFSSLERVTILKIFGLFGPYEDKKRLIKNNIIRASEGKPVLVFQDRRMDYFSTYDMWEVIKEIISRVNLAKTVPAANKQVPSVIPLVYNYDSPLQISDIAKWMSRHFNVPIQVIKKGMQEDYYESFDQPRRSRCEILCGQKFNNIHDSIIQMIEDMKNNYEI